MSDNKKDADRSNWMTVEEVAKYLKISIPTIYNFVRENKIPHSRVGKQYRFNRSVIDNWLLDNTEGG